MSKPRTAQPKPDVPSRAIRVSAEAWRDLQSTQTQLAGATGVTAPLAAVLDAALGIGLASLRARPALAISSAPAVEANANGRRGK